MLMAAGAGTASGQMAGERLGVVVADETRIREVNRPQTAAELDPLRRSVQQMGLA